MIAINIQRIRNLVVPKCVQPFSIALTLPQTQNMLASMCAFVDLSVILLRHFTFRRSLSLSHTPVQLYLTCSATLYKALLVQYDAKSFIPLQLMAQKYDRKEQGCNHVLRVSSFTWILSHMVCCSPAGPCCPTNNVDGTETIFQRFTGSIDRLP